MPMTSFQTPLKMYRGHICPSVPGFKVKVLFGAMQLHHKNMCMTKHFCATVNSQDKYMSVCVYIALICGLNFPALAIVISVHIATVSCMAVTRVVRIIISCSTSATI